MTPDAKRKLTTILAADVVGYSRLMSEDEERTLAVLKGYRELIDTFISKHVGRVFSTAGDAFLAEFGSAVEAVRCAISIQEDIAVRNAELPENEQMWFRMGVNVGDVLIEGEDLFGDGVNIAARLEGLAERGGICISGSTFEQVKNKLSVAFDDIGAQSVKNIPYPVPAFRVVPGKVAVKRGDAPSADKLDFLHTTRGRVLIGVSVAAIAAAMVAYALAPGLLTGKHPYDGKWQVTVDSLEGCVNNEPKSFPILVENGVIDQPQMKFPKKGTISKDGSFEIFSTDQDGLHMNKQTGTVKGDEGKGVFQGKKPGCEGVVTLTRVK
jgi:class 3 adenylate cyclase